MGQTEFDLYLSLDLDTRLSREEMDEAWTIYEELDDAQQLLDEQQQNYLNGLGL